MDECALLTGSVTTIAVLLPTHDRSNRIAVFVKDNTKVLYTFVMNAIVSLFRICLSDIIKSDVCVASASLFLMVTGGEW